MPKVSKLLKASKVKHPELGEIIELYTPAAFFLNETQDAEGNYVVEGVGIRLTSNTAAKLAHALLEMVRKKPFKGPKK